MQIQEKSPVAQTELATHTTLSKTSFTKPSFQSTLASGETRSWGRCLYDSTLGLFVRLFKWLFCCGKKGGDTIKPEAHTPEILKPVAIPRFVPKVAGMDPRKEIWFNEALKIFHEKELKSDYQVHSQGRGQFVLKQDKTPAYFSEKLSTTEQAYFCSPEYFDYNPVDATRYYESWVDFANRKLLGAALSHGQVQEEQMAEEIPELLMHGMTHLQPGSTRSLVETRSGGDGVQKGSPSPLLFDGLWRVQAVDPTRTYGRQFNRNVTTANAKTFLETVDPAQKVNILAIAAPKLATRNNLDEQTDQRTLEDLFNTFVAGFTLAKAQADKAGKKGLVHTGQIGAGAFGNNPSVVFALQRLAADQVGVELRFYDYDTRATRDGNDLYEDLRRQIDPDATIQEVLKTAASRFHYVLTT